MAVSRVLQGATGRMEVRRRAAHDRPILADAAGDKPGRPVPLADRTNVLVANRKKGTGLKVGSAAGWAVSYFGADAAQVCCCRARRSSTCQRSTPSSRPPLCGSRGTGVAATGGPQLPQMLAP